MTPILFFSFIGRRTPPPPLPPALPPALPPDIPPPPQADVLVSELLGSWGDNELSPECLDGAQRYLKPGGLSIPADYTSFVAPLSSSKLWNEVPLPLKVSPTRLDQIWHSLLLGGGPPFFCTYIQRFRSHD